MLALGLALGSSLTGGCTDFLGGMTSRRIGTMQFMLCTQLIGLMLAGGWVAISGQPVPGVEPFAAAAAAGLGLTLGLAAFLQAMVVGTIAIVAPISATSVVVPIVAGIARGERPSPAQAIGIAAVVAGIILAVRPAGEHSAPTESGLGHAFLAALGFGVFFWLMASASHHGVPWALLIARAIPSLMLVVGVGIRRPSMRPTRGMQTAGAILASALLAFISTTLYAFATLHGQLAIVSVLASLPPVVTVLLAYQVLGERVHGTQQFGIVAVLAGVVALST